MEKQKEALFLITERFQITDLIESDTEKYENFVNYIDELIVSDMNKLIHILYRLDVVESKVRKALAQESESVSSGKVIADLIIEREVEKIEFKNKYKSK